MTGVTGATGAHLLPATSATSLAIGTGARRPDSEQSGLRSRGSGAGVVFNYYHEDYMEGVVTSYSGTSLVVNVDNAVAGTFANWNINLAGDGETVGPAGSPARRALRGSVA